MDGMAEKAERFLEARKQNLVSDDNVRTYDSQYEQDETKTDQRQQRKCYNCGRIGHTRALCRQEGGGSEQQCSECKMYGHLVEVCRNNKAIASALEAGSGIGAFNRTSKKQDFNEFDGGLRAIKGKVGDYVVNTLRDNGCNTICVNKKFVRNEQKTGEYKVCKLIDGSEQKLELAKVDIDTPYLTKQGITVVCMNDPTFYHSRQPRLPLELSHWLRAMEYLRCYPRVLNLGYLSSNILYLQRSKYQIQQKEVRQPLSHPCSHVVFQEIFVTEVHSHTLDLLRL